MSSTGPQYDPTATGVTDAGCAGDILDDVSPPFEGRGDFITVFEVSTPNKNTSGMTSLFARVRLSVRACVCADLRGVTFHLYLSGPRACSSTRTAEPGSNLPACLGPGLISPSDPPSVSWRSAPSPHTSLHSSRPDPRRHPTQLPSHQILSFLLLLPSLSVCVIIGLSIGPHTHGQSQHIRSPSDICESHGGGGGSPYVNQRERRESTALHARVERV